MLELLYKKGYLDYKTLILDNYKLLQIDEKEAVVMIKILDQCQIKRNIKITEIVQLTQFSKDEIHVILYKLSELGYYETYFELISGKGEEEFYNITPFFNKLEIVLSKSDNNVQESEIKELIDLLEKKIFRTLTPMEFNTINSWLDENHSIEDIKHVINDFADGSYINFKAIEKQLINYNKRVSKRPDTSKLSVEDDLALDNLRKMVNGNR